MWGSAQKPGANFMAVLSLGSQSIRLQAQQMGSRGRQLSWESTSFCKRTRVEARAGGLHEA
jgi:hypothetical protein